MSGALHGRKGNRIDHNAAPMTSVYDGQTCIGFILARGHAGFEAFTPDEKSRGIFPTQRDAIATLSSAEAA